MGKRPVSGPRRSMRERGRFTKGLMYMRVYMRMYDASRYASVWNDILPKIV